MTKSILLAAAAATLLLTTPSAHAERRGKQGTVTREATVTGPNGRTNRIEETRTRGQGTATRERTRTFPDGASRSVEGARTRTGEGTFETSRTATGRNGETRTQTGDFAVSRTEDGRSVTGTVQTENRGQIDVTKDVTRGPDGRSVASSATFEDGTSVSRAASTQCAQGAGCTTQSSVTDRQGRVTTATQSSARTESGWERSRDTTFPDGSTRAVDVTGTKTAPGEAVVERTVTGRDGETRTSTGAVTVTRTP